jgi:GH15 family glucan-1,4-alpha-glucosidase
MISVFTDIYPINKKLNIPFLGRYFNDKYFDGNPWIISTIALYQYSFVCPNFYYNKNEFKNFLKFLYDDKKLLLSEQIHRETGEDVSVEKLTWNYSELITLFKFIKNFQIDNLIDLFVTE